MNKQATVLDVPYNFVMLTCALPTNHTDAVTYSTYCGNMTSRSELVCYKKYFQYWKINPKVTFFKRFVLNKQQSKFKHIK